MAPVPTPSPPSGSGGPDALPRRTRLAYASASLGAEALAQSRNLWLLYYYAPPEDADLEALLPLGVVGALLTAAAVVEAVYDPLVGWWSDRARSRLGRRLPFVLAATPLWALFAFLLFTPPQDASAAATGAYLFLVFQLFHAFGTLSGLPYEALFPEIARTSDERIRVVTARVYFGAAGGAVGLSGSGLIVDGAGFREMALAMALVALAFRYLGMVGVWGRASRTEQPVLIPLRKALGITFSNVYFLLFLPTFVLFQISLQMLLGSLPFLVNAIVGPEDEGTWVAIITGVALGTTIAVVPLFGRLARRTSKRQAYRAAMLWAGLSFPLVSLAGLIPEIPDEAQVVAVMAAAGAPLAGVFLFPAALTADIVDYDSLKTGFRREGAYFGAQNFVEKMATSLAPLTLASLLVLGNTAEDPLGIRLVGPAAGLIVLVGWFVFRRYDLPDDVTAAGRA
jgi:glycoside/pentoside/hexuronide:cation symporter, GPH family